MGRSWKEIKQDKHAFDSARGRDVEAAEAHAQAATNAYILGDRLAELRRAHGLSQTQLAARMHISQPRISALEQGDLAQVEVGTIERYVEALGGNLRLVAAFGDHDVNLDTTAACA